MEKCGKLARKILFPLSYAIVVLFALGILLYIIETDFGKSGEPVGFGLATISAIIGGLILASGFLGQASASPQLRLRRIGVFYVIATIAFVTYGICFPLLKVETATHVTTVATYVAAIGIAAGALSFAMGTVLLVYVIPDLWTDRGRPAA